MLDSVADWYSRTIARASRVRLVKIVHAETAHYVPADLVGPAGWAQETAALCKTRPVPPPHPGKGEGGRARGGVGRGLRLRARLPVVQRGGLAVRRHGPTEGDR